jgi:ribosome-binding protein aMBF1 (putative translation factor)
MLYTKKLINNIFDTIIYKFIMSFQDWTPVNIGNKAGKPKTTSPKPTYSGNNNGVTIKKIYDPNDPNAEPETRPVMMEREFGLKMQKARMAKGLTQQQLATTLSMPLSTIRDYEAGKGVRNGKIVDLINRWIAKNANVSSQ